MAEVGAAALPVLVGLILLFGYVKGVPVFDTFLSGAKEGLRTSLKLLPTLVGLLMAVSMVRASGLLELLCVPLAPLAESLGVSPELLPLALLRPISGSGGLRLHLGFAPALWSRQPDRPDGLGALLLHGDHFLRRSRLLWGLRLPAPAPHFARRPFGGLHRLGVLHSHRKALGVGLPFPARGGYNRGKGGAFHD